MTRTRLVVCLVILTAAILIGGISKLQSKPMPLPVPTPQDKTIPIQVGATTINAIVAQTAAEQDLGLGNRIALPQTEGMLFPFSPKQIPTFWMYRMHFALDFIWIADDKVVDLTQNVPPPAHPTATPSDLYGPTVPVDAVIEVNAGFVKAHGIKVGDAVQLPQ